MTSAKTENTSTKSNENGVSDNLKLHHLFKLMKEQKASDLHLAVNTSPRIRVNGKIIKVDLPILTGENTKRLVYEVLSEKEIFQIENSLELDFSFEIKGLARFRGNVSYSSKNISATFRLIPEAIPSYKHLKLPDILIELSEQSSGLILLTGSTGSGKSTTLASLIDRLNENFFKHIVTIEDPVEFIYQHKKCIINQREIGSDTLNFSSALKGLLRQDPDIILIGELRDMETIEAALTLAETGHMVFGTLHTNSAIGALDRIINVFPNTQQDKIQTLLSFVCRGIMAQQLIPSSFKAERILAYELLVCTSGVKNLIREHKHHQIYSQMQLGQDKSGMNTMNQCLLKHIEDGNINRSRALEYSPFPEELEREISTKIRKI